MNHTVTMQQPKRAAALNIRTITMTALLSAMAYVLAFVEFPVPLSPSFAKMDLSDFPALIGAFASGFPAGLFPHIFFHPDYTVGCGISPHRALLRFADFTAGQGFHLAPKMSN